MKELLLYGKNILVISEKRLLMFLMATLALLLSGVLISEETDFGKTMVVILGGLCGVVLFYDVNFVDYRACLKTRVRQFLEHPRKVFFFYTLILLIPYALEVLSDFSFLIFAIAAVLAFLYSHPFKFQGKIFRLKNVIFFKNFMIGISWGALVLIGAGSPDNQMAVCLSIFVMIQVFIGSMIRDLADVRSDTQNGIITMPVIFGTNKTISFMHAVNFGSLLVAGIIGWEENMIALFVGVIGWRMLTLVMIKESENPAFWRQTANIMTCCLFFVILLIQHIYGLN